MYILTLWFAIRCIYFDAFDIKFDTNFVILISNRINTLTLCSELDLHFDIFDSNLTYI